MIWNYNKIWNCFIHLSSGRAAGCLAAHNSDFK